MFVSVIVPVFNGETVLPACLEALKHQSGLVFEQDFEVIVVDDGSTDRSAAAARGLGIGVVSQPNSGPAAARNHGARLAQAEILAFTDADCVPAEDWLEKMIAPFVDPEVVGVKGIYRSEERGVVARFVQAEYEFKYARMRSLAKIDFIDTYSAAYRREVFLANGGFNQHFPVPSVEDQEFSFRLARQDLKMVLQPCAAVYHRHDRSLVEYARRKFGIGYWKAAMLRWLPEKAKGDSHTTPSQPLEIALAGLIGLGFAAAWFTAAGWWLTAGGLAAFLYVIRRQLKFVWRLDRSIIWAAPGMLFLRATALGAGLAAGFLFRVRNP